MKLETLMSVPAIILNFLSICSITSQTCSSTNKCLENAPCCSKWGYCGAGNAYCGEGCNEDGSFNNMCKRDNFKTEGSCSINNVCPEYAPCCSRWGYCGTGDAYCGEGCNKDGSFNNICEKDEISEPKENCTVNSICFEHISCCNKFKYYDNDGDHCDVSCQEFASFNVQCNLNSENNDHNNKEDKLNKNKSYDYSNDNKNTKCNSWKVDFTKGKNDMFTYTGSYEFNEDGMLLKAIKGNIRHPRTRAIMGYGPLVTSKNAVNYGKIIARIFSARIEGIITSFTLINDDKDEISWEWAGNNEYQAKSSYHLRGMLNDTKRMFHNTSFNTHNEMHDYSINWNSEKIQWTIDDVIVRTVLKSEIKNSSELGLPTRPMTIYLSLWDGSASSTRIRNWAGYFVDWNDQEFIKNGGYISSLVKSITYEC